MADLRAIAKKDYQHAEAGVVLLCRMMIGVLSKCDKDAVYAEKIQLLELGSSKENEAYFALLGIIYDWAVCTWCHNYSILC